jgi:hypothetical protein
MRAYDDAALKAVSLAWTGPLEPGLDFYQTSAHLGERCGSWSGLPRVAGDGAGGVHHPGSFSPAVQQKIHHTLRIKATGINPEPNARQAIEAPLDDLLKLVDRPTVGGGLDPACELCGLGVICVAVAVGQIRSAAASHRLRRARRAGAVAREGGLSLSSQRKHCRR